MSNIQKIENISKADMLALRRHGIGGTDSPVICDVSPWSTKLKLWLKKTGAREEETENSDKLAFEVGSALEQLVADLTCKRLSDMFGKEIKCHKVNFTYVKDGFKFANPDRVFYNFNGFKTILECKTTNFFNKDAWGTDTDPKIPEYYKYQINWYCGIMDYPKAIISCLIGGNSDFVMREWTFDPDLFAHQEREAEAFWELVENNVPPIAVGDDLPILTGLPKLDSTVEVSEEVVNEYLETETAIKLLQEQIKPLDKKLKDLKAYIVQRLEGADGVSGIYYIKNTIVPDSPTVDSKRLEAEMPEIFEKYSKIKKGYNKITIKEL